MSQRTVILDSSAMLAYPKKEPGGELVHRLLLDKSVEKLAHSVNLCEVL